MLKAAKAAMEETNVFIKSDDSDRIQLIWRVLEFTNKLIIYEIIKFVIGDVCMWEFKSRMYSNSGGNSSTL